MVTVNFNDEFAAYGLKNTKNRQEILKVLMDSTQPLTADQIYFSLNQGGESMNLSTIYRTLATLSEKGILLKVVLADESKTLFEYNRQIHKHYLICQDCRTITPIEHCPIAEYEKKLSQEMNFHITGHKLGIYGYCQACWQKRNQLG